jgi:hypothetical protein
MPDVLQDLKARLVAAVKIQADRRRERLVVQILCSPVRMWMERDASSGMPSWLRQMSVTVVVLTCVWLTGSRDAFATTVGNVVREFIATPSPYTWERVAVSARAGQVEGYVAAVVEYEWAVVQRELPNSQASEEDLDAKFERLRKTCDVALQKIKGTMPPGIWPLLTAMAKQQDDDLLAFAGLEIIARLSPDRFKEVSEAILAKNPGRRSIVDDVSRRWLPARRK